MSSLLQDKYFKYITIISKRVQEFESCTGVLYLITERVYNKKQPKRIFCHNLSK